MYSGKKVFSLTELQQRWKGLKKSQTFSSSLFSSFRSSPSLSPWTTLPCPPSPGTPPTGAGAWTSSGQGNTQTSGSCYSSAGCHGRRSSRCKNNYLLCKILMKSWLIESMYFISMNFFCCDVCIKTFYLRKQLFCLSTELSSKGENRICVNQAISYVTTPTLGKQISINFPSILVSSFSAQKKRTTKGAMA